MNRSDDMLGHVQRLSVQFWDDIKNNYTTDPDNVTEVFFWVKQDGDTWVEVQEQKNATHYFIDFNATCSYKPGIRQWKVNTTSDCFQDNTTDEFNIEIYGNLSTAILFPTSLVNRDQGANITFNGTVDDDCGNDAANISIKFKINRTGYDFYG